MSSSSRSVRILHVDDEPDFAHLTATFLEREDDRFDVETTTNADEGLDLLVDTDFDCVVSDYDMPGQDGIEFMQAARENYPDLPFILFTGKGSEEIASEAISAGVTDYIQKEGGTDQYAILANRIRNAVESLRAKRQRQRRLDAIETAQEGISILDEDGHYIYVNEVFADLHGYEPEEMIGEHWELAYPDEDVPQVRESILPEVERAGYWHGETTSRRSDGTDVVVDHTLAMTDRGELICTVRDISGQKEREHELERYEKILDTMDDIAFAVDENRTVTYVNETISEYIDAPTEALVGERVMDLADEYLSDPDDRGRFEAVLDRMFDVDEEADQPKRMELSLDFPEGEVTFEYQFSLLTDDENTSAVVVTMRDVTDRKQREQALREERDRLNEFASIVSHDLRNPLRLAQGRLDLAREECESKHLEPIAGALDRMNRIIEDMLASAREGVDIGSTEPVVIRNIIESAWELVSGTAERADLRYRDEESPFPEVDADRDRLHRLLENLLRNTIDHAGEDVVVTVGMLEDGFYVEDDGPGISEDDRDEVFDAGYSTAEEGTGFGLGIVRRIAEAHGWDIRVSEGADGGARFEITGIELS